MIPTNLMHEGISTFNKNNMGHANNNMQHANSSWVSLIRRKQEQEQ